MITYTEGNLLTTNTQILVHQTNCQGVMGAGLAKQIRAKYPKVYTAYKQLCSTTAPERLLGTIQCIPISEHTAICNLFGQKTYGRYGQHTDYAAFHKALTALKTYMKQHDKTTVAFPKYIGCGLAGGDWNSIHNMLQNTFQSDPDITCIIVHYTAK